MSDLTWAEWRADCKARGKRPERSDPALRAKRLKAMRAPKPSSARAQGGRGVPSDAELNRRIAERAAVWEKRFALLPPGLHLNAICLEFGVGYETVRRWAKKCGYKFGSVLRMGSQGDAWRAR